MEIYISILRGINVGGHNKVKMADLKKMYEDLQFKNVQTYVQSGNVIFSTDITDIKNLEKAISEKIETQFLFKAAVIVLTVDVLRKVIGGNPYAKNKETNNAFLYVTFLAHNIQITDDALIIGKKHPEEEIAISSRAVYLYCPNGYGRTKLNNNFLEAKLGVAATTRNWNTTLKLLDLATKLCE
ncbi:DUF1697 domain-containing protein [Sphingobacterium sp. lm-10]|uniref:DUF1697 domain-containing protein n=1 Tax=Sphingobacterium sp. lm-10 TaxID=2944904 RepID=UPI0020220510|nr:DUF1697 domain-containing protein [Sphingobacterium sp. lm-10]MCL7987439.1 DUF1697 domain-containing protein [Sphingobacterium sp. lm-10]